MTIYFSSDHHFYHANVIKYCNRPYSSIEEMNEKLIANWNSVVQPEDTVYYLGDFSLAFRPVELYSKRLNGVKKLVAGNHDWCHIYNKKSKGGGLKKWIDKYEEHGWTVLPLQIKPELPGLGRVNMCHLPYAGDVLDSRDNGYTDKFQRYRLEDRGELLLCGHVHEKWKSKLGPNGGLMINVGVDVWDYRPVSLDEIILYKKLMEIG